MNPDTKEPVCVGCGKPWKGDSLYCPTCQKINVGTMESGLAGLVATYKRGTAEYNAKFNDACHKCGKENTVSSKGWFCSDCIHAMSWNSYSQRYGEV
jgi:predicted amidophosphoribosyltransferase